jgi:hypothetical protein
MIGLLLQPGKSVKFDQIVRVNLEDIRYGG